MNKLRRSLRLGSHWPAPYWCLRPCWHWGRRTRKDKAGYDRAARATVLHAANVYVTADADAQKISLVTPGHEVVVIERSGPWVKVFANTDVDGRHQ